MDQGAGGEPAPCSKANSPHHARCLIDSNEPAKAGNEQPSAHVSRLQHSHRFYRRPFFRPRNADLACIVSFPCAFVMAGCGAASLASVNLRCLVDAESPRWGSLET